MTFQKELDLAFQLFEEQRLSESLARYEKLLNTPLTTEEEMKVRFGYGYPLSEAGRIEEAIKNYRKLKHLGEVVANPAIVSQSLHQIGMVYRQAKQYDKALKLFKEEREVIHRHFQDQLLFKAANDYEIGYTNLLLNNYEKALDALSKSLALALKADDLVMIACAQRGLGEYYASQNNSQLALEYFQNSIQSFELAGDQLGAKEVNELIDAVKKK